jgi:hypothetical protein
VSIDERYAHRRARERARGVEPAEPAADNDDVNVRLHISDFRFQVS